MLLPPRATIARLGNSEPSDVVSGGQAFLAREAYGSVILLASILAIWGLVHVAAVRALPFWPFGATRIALATGALLALLYFVRTRKRPNLRVAVGFSWAAIAAALALVPWIGWA